MPKRKAKPAWRYAEQPAVAAILKLLRNPRGATVAEIAKARGLQLHTVRSVLSRLGSKGGLVLTRTRSEGRAGLVYRVSTKAGSRHAIKSPGPTTTR
jgi:predicted ArsR family transcriptional regulator